jgi:hydrogenase nickel insertion protein HypA
MHEYSVALQIATIVKKAANGKPVKKININIGALSGIFSESLLMYLELLFLEDNMKDIKIETKETPAVFICDCGNEYVAQNLFTLCPNCKKISRKIKSGHDCIVESIEVEDGNE